jgi:hypothetical protein
MDGIIISKGKEKKKKKKKKKDLLFFSPLSVKCFPDWTGLSF